MCCESYKLSYLPTVGVCKECNQGVDEHGVSTESSCVYSTPDEPCPSCDEGYLHLKQIEDILEYKGKTKPSILYYSVCDKCNSETATTEDLQNNHHQMIVFKNEINF